MSVAPLSLCRDERSPLAAFAARCSIEATLPAADEIAALRSLLPAGTPVYLSAVPSRPPERQIEAAILVARAGFEPVPHLAVRNFDSTAAAEKFLRRMTQEAGARRLLVVSGDRDRPLGPFPDALAMIESGLLQRHGIAAIGIGAYPEGHPRIAADILERALAAKLAAAARGGLHVHIVTQFAFDAAPILDALRRWRAQGIDAPVRIGLAGPATLAKLIGYARRCGVRAAFSGAVRGPGALRLASAAPDAILRPLAAACAGDRLGDVAPHFFSFGGLAQTAQWARAVAEGRFTLDGSGFVLEHDPEKCAAVFRKDHAQTER